jgi:CheY-like chemotaxis protein
MCPDQEFRQPAGSSEQPPQETILVVDDDAEVLALTRFVLSTEGYSVLEASGGEDALRIAERHAEPIHLLLTDVVMPGMNGTELADRLGATRHETKVLFMSAYTIEHVAAYGIFSGDPIIQKPFTVMGLTQKVRKTIGDRPPPASPFARTRAAQRRP